MVYILMVFLVLSATLDQENITIGIIFGTLFLYLLPFIFDYYTMYAVSKWGRRLKAAGFWSAAISAGVMLASMLYTLFQSVDHTLEVKTIYILVFTVPVEVVKYTCGIWFLLGFLDWIVFSSREEKAIRKEFREREQASNEHIEFPERVKYYEHRKVND
jgi:small-conductance mechanosensitive channel